ncbi:HEAT repeat domain-containing protein [Desulforhopalus sp. 52FAK]
MRVHNAETFNVLLFQHNIYDLEQGYFEVLENGDFCAELQQYLVQLFTLGRKDIINNVLIKVGHCVTDDTRPKLQVKALRVITEFSSVLDGLKDKELFSLVCNILTSWLKRQRHLQSTHVKLFGQVEVIIKKMFSLHLWRQTEPLISVSKQITTGVQPVDNLLKKEVSKLHRTIADQKAITLLVNSFLESKDHEDAVVGDLLQALTPHSSEAMIHGLFKCNKKNKRLALLEMISLHREGVLPVLIRKLKDRQPWYVVRNSMILLGSTGDADLYHFARPFLNHPDPRVQREVVLCIFNLGGELVADRLIASFPRLNDRVKPVIIEKLSILDDYNIEAMFLDVLEQRGCFKSTVREELIEKICSSDKLTCSERAITVLREIVEERESLASVSEPSFEYAKGLLKRLYN